MASPFKKISSVMRYDGACVLTWAFLPIANYPANFLLQVEFSRAGGEWSVIAENLTNVCYYTDLRRLNYNKRLNSYYRVRLKVVGSSEEWVSPVCEAGRSLSYPYSSEASNAIRLIEKELRLSGCRGTLLKKKEWGSHCPLCTDFAGQDSVNEKCPRCLGTGVDGGYYAGITMNMLEDQEKVSEDSTPLGQTTASSIMARCVGYPWIQRGDVWVDNVTNDRFYITGVSPLSKYKQVPLVVAVSMNKLEMTDIMYSAESDALVNGKDIWDEARVDYTPAPPLPVANPTSSWTAALENNM